MNAPEGGNTALFWAAIHDHKEAVSVLAGERSGLRPNMPTNRPEIQHSRLEAQRICTSTRGRMMGLECTELFLAISLLIGKAFAENLHCV